MNYGMFHFPQIPGMFSDRQGGASMELIEFLEQLDNSAAQLSGNS